MPLLLLEDATLRSLVLVPNGLDLDGAAETLLLPDVDVDREVEGAAGASDWSNVDDERCF